MKLFMFVSLTAALFSSTGAFAAGSSACDTIAKSCKSAGFKSFSDPTKGSTSGHDLWVDCYCPLSQGKAQPSTAKLALPAAANLTQAIAQCQQSPKYTNKCQ